MKKPQISPVLTPMSIIAFIFFSVIAPLAYISCKFYGVIPSGYATLFICSICFLIAYISENKDDDKDKFSIDNLSVIFLNATINLFWIYFVILCLNDVIDLEDILIIVEIFLVLGYTLSAVMIVTRTLLSLYTNSVLRANELPHIN